MTGATVRAAFLRAPGELEIGEAPLPPLGPDDVRIRVEACGICATNLHGWSLAPSGAAAMPGAHGHEIAGVVETVGDTVRGLGPGDRVCVDPAAACGCGACPACAAGDPMRCRDQAMLPVWGFADALVVGRRAVVPLPAGMASDVASLAEPLASAVHGLRHSHTAAADGRIDGARVLVLGAGALGLLAVAAARQLGAAEVVAVARHAHQAELAAALGAHRVLGAGDDGLAGTVRRLRADVAVEAAGGRATTLPLAFSGVDRGGEVVVLGLFDGPQQLDVGAAVMRNVRAFFAAAYGARDGRTDVEVAVDVLAATPALARLVTHRVALDRLAEGAALAGDRGAGAVRVVVHP